MQTHRRCFAFALALLFSGMGWSQPSRFDSPSKDDVAKWLIGGDAQERAWGAFYAAKRRDASSLTLLEGLAERWEPLPTDTTIEWPQVTPAVPLSPRDTDDRDAMTAVLDGVIVLGGKIPVDALGRLAGTFPVQTGVLLARLPHAEIEPELLVLYRDPAPANALQQRIAAEMLAVRPPVGFAASVMKGITVLGRVQVNLPGETIFGMGSGGSCGEHSVPNDAGWPLVGQYSLVFNEPGPEIAAFPIAAVGRGSRPVFALRRSTTRTNSSTDCTGSDMWTNRSKLELVAKMLGVETRTLPIGTSDVISIVAANTSEYEQKLATFVASVESKFLQLETLLEKARLVTAQEIVQGDAQPRLSLTLWDSRAAAGRTFDLPEVPFGGPSVVWTKPGAFY